MGYFPNGTAGACYEERYCANCIHEGDPDGPGCPIMALHTLYNYDQFEDVTVSDFLSTLIPETDDGTGQCSMFVATADPEAEEAERRRLAMQPIKYREALQEMRGVAA